MASVELIGITKRYGSVEVIRSLDLTVADGSFCALLGPSGCGKSTMLRMIAGLETVTDGQVKIGDREVTHIEPAKRGVAMVFQSYALYPHLTVAQNICFSLSLAGESKAKQAEAAARVAKMLQLEPLLARRPAELSGGQGSASPSVAPWCVIQRCSCSMSLCPTSMRCCAARCGWNWRGFMPNWAAPWSM
jgi:multiple sugar transport system ATP-binding protein